MKRCSGDPFGLVGRILDRKYRVDRVVAEGGFGIVYQGHHLALERAIAVKALKLSAVDAEGRSQLLASFLQEARIIARLRHPNVVTVIDAGVTSLDAVPTGLPWMVLEWLEGCTLEEHLASRRGNGGRSPSECLELLRPVLAAVAHAHELGIVHRDLKASNILLAGPPENTTPKVLDFGIAKLVEIGAASQDETTRRVRAFSAVSAAPEQVSAAPTGPWTDVHALGLLLTRVCTDEPPYPDGDSTSRYRAVFDAARPTPSRFGVDVGSWEPVLERALSLRPSERQPNAGALLEELESALALDGVSRAPRWSTARKRWVVLATASLGVVSMGIARSESLESRSQPAVEEVQASLPAAESRVSSERRVPSPELRVGSIPAAMDTAPVPRPSKRALPSPAAKPQKALHVAAASSSSPGYVLE